MKVLQAKGPQAGSSSGQLASQAPAVVSGMPKSKSLLGGTQVKEPVVGGTSASVLSPLRTVLSPVVAGGTRRRPLYVPIKNAPGVLLMIPKDELYIDAVYQRKPNDRLIGRIAANWSWVACGCLHVAQRSIKGRFFVFDGQHRFEAAKMIDEITELPCIVFELENVRDEALGFLAVNTERRIPNMADQFKALIMSGDQSAMILRDAALRWGRTIGAPSDATHISCVSDCLRQIRYNDGSFNRMFPVLSELCEGNAMTGRLIRGMCFLERYMPKGQSLADERWRRRIVHIGYLEITRSIRETSSFEGQGTDKVCAEGILRAINKNLREKLVMVESRAGAPQPSPAFNVSRSNS